MPDIKLKEVLAYGNSFCVLPFIHKHIDLNNQQKLCCHSNTAIDDDRLQEIRQAMLDNKPVQECKKCVAQEQIPTFSERQYYNKEWLKSNPNIDFDNPEELSYDLRYSNLCNLRCQTCNAGSSSEWARYLGQENVYKTVEPNVSINPNAKRIYFAGGEPFMIKSFSNILNSIENTDIEVVINTNATVLTDHMMSALKRFTNICFVLSIDGTGETIERIRTLCSWDIICKNIKTLRQELNPKLYVNTVLQHDNIDNIPELAQWIDDQNITMWHTHICTNPEQFHYSHYKGNIAWQNDLFEKNCVVKNSQVQQALKLVYKDLTVDK